MAATTGSQCTEGTMGAATSPVCTGSGSTAGSSTVATTPGNTGSKCTEGTTAAATSPDGTGSAGHAADAGQLCGHISSLNHVLILLLHQEQRDAQLAQQVIQQDQLLVSCVVHLAHIIFSSSLHHQDQRAAELTQQLADQVQHDHLSQEQAQDEDMNIHMSQQHQPHQPPDDHDPQPPDHDDPQPPDHDPQPAPPQFLHQ